LILERYEDAITDKETRIPCLPIRSDNQGIYLGSAKSNIGHGEANLRGFESG
jgi:acyl transferase domain-containing protein